MLHTQPGLFARLDLQKGRIEGGLRLERHLSDLSGYFANEAAYEAALADKNPVIYTVSTVTPAEGDGQLNYGLGAIYPGRVGREYHMTKGHLHTWREAAELYVGLRGEGAMLLEDEETGESKLVPLAPEGLVYVPGYTAHRTINTGEEPLLYLGIYPAEAGHDYAFVAERNFRKVVVERRGAPVLLDRKIFMSSLTSKS